MTIENPRQIASPQELTLITSESSSQPAELPLLPDSRLTEAEDRTRHYLTIIVTVVVMVVALVALVYPAAEAILDKLLPLLTLVIGYFFGHHNRQTRS